MESANHSLALRFRQHWTQHFSAVRLPVLLACSGGVDSMALAGLLLETAIPFALAHCNFRLRGAEADADEALVRRWAAAQGLSFYATSFDTAVIAAGDRRGIQETARRLRYDWLLQLCGEHGFGAVATAHHAGDVAETVLLNLFRGSGIAGLHGIAAIREDVIRPLLFADKPALQAFATAKGIPWREDASNESDDYSRNAIRNRLLPAIETLFPDAGKRIVESAGRLAEAEIIYQEAVQRRIAKLREQRGADVYVPLRKLLKMQPLATWCYELFRPYGFAAAQTGELLKLLRAESGAVLHSPTHRLIRDRDFLIVTSSAGADTDFLLVEAAPASIETAGAAFHFRHQEAAGSAFISTDADVATIDAAKLEWPLILRRRRTGDYFYPLGMGGKKKKVGRLLTSLKLPLHHKEDIWVLESGRRIVWVAGLRLDERFKVTAATKALLEVRIERRAGA